MEWMRGILFDVREKEEKDLKIFNLGKYRVNIDIYIYIE